MDPLRYKPRTVPFRHQARATLRAARARNYAIFMEPRCGKSKAALDTVGIWAMKRPGLKVLVLAPRIALNVWEHQIKLHYPHFAMCESFLEEWDSPGNTDYITHFFLAGREETFRRTRTRSGYLRPKQDILEAWRPDVVILDEAHEYKKPGGVSAQDCWRLIRRLREARRSNTPNGDRPMPWVLLLSGTPNPKGWIDLFAPFRIMDETIFGTSVADFKERHVQYGHGRRKWTVLGYHREDEIRAKVKKHSYRISAEEAGLAGRQFYQTIPVPLPPPARRAYMRLAEEFVTQLETGEVISAKNAGVKRLRLLQLTGGFTTDGVSIHNAKLQALKAYAGLLLEQGESVVVYSRFTPEVEAVTLTLATAGFRTFRVDGTVEGRSRLIATEALRTKPPVPTALSFQYQAGSRAIELVGAAEVVYYSAPDGWVDFRQTSARVQGPNQHRPVRYSFLVCPGTVDVSVIRGLRHKEDGHAELMRNPRRYLFGL